MSVGEEVSGLRLDVAQGSETEDCANQSEVSGRQIREAVPGARGRRLKKVTVELTPNLRGWMAYFKLTETKQSLHSCQELAGVGIDGKMGVSLRPRPTRAVVEHRRQPHEPGFPEVRL